MHIDWKTKDCQDDIYYHHETLTEWWECMTICDVWCSLDLIYFKIKMKFTNQTVRKMQHVVLSDHDSLIFISTLSCDINFLKNSKVFEADIKTENDQERIWFSINIHLTIDDEIDMTSLKFAFCFEKSYTQKWAWRSTHWLLMSYTLIFILLL